MDELTRFEERLATALERQAGPRRPIDAVGIARAVASRRSRSTTVAWPRTSRLVRSWQAVAFAVLLGLALAAVGGALQLVGSPSTPAIPMPASLTVASPACPEVGPPAPAPGVLPTSGAGAIEDPRNGLLAIWHPNAGLRLIDPNSGDDLASWSGVSTTADGWSPDGRWLAARHPATQPPEGGCWDIVLVSSDGRQVSPLARSAKGDMTFAMSWSRDGRWLAVATTKGKADDWAETAIDVFAIGEGGSVIESRRVWRRESVVVGDLAWGPDGTLAWKAPSEDGEGYALELLRAGDAVPMSIQLIDDTLPIRWTADGSSIVALSRAGLRVIAADDQQDRVLDLPTRTRSGIEVLEDTVAVSSAGRIYFPAVSTGDIPRQILASVALDGTDPRDLTSSASPAPSGGVGPVLSPDQELVAFRGADDLEQGIWLVGSDGTGLRQLTGLSGILSWQPLP